MRNYNPGFRTQGNLEVSVTLVFIAGKCMYLKPHKSILG